MREKHKLIYNFYKNTPAYRAFAAAYRQHRAGHTYILSSEDELSSKYTAGLIACSLLCKKPLSPCLNCSDCVRVMAATHPDCTVFPENGNKMYVSDVDTLVQHSAYTPAEGDAKVYIINHGQTLSTQAQNKLLKTLEEPPQGTYIVLCSTSADSILPTLRSRCLTLDIKPLSSEDIAQLLRLAGTDSSRADLISLTAGGDASKAIAMIEDDAFADILQAVYSVTQSCRSAENIPVLAEKLSKGDKLQTAKALQIYFRDMLMLRTGLAEVVINKTETERMLSDGKNYTDAALMGLIDSMNSVKEAAAVNVNFQALLEGVLTEVWQHISGADSIG